MLGLDPRPEHESQIKRRRAEWALEMVQSWQMADAIQLMNERAVRQLQDAALDDHAALLRAKVTLDVVSEFQTVLAELISDWQIVEMAREREEERYNDHG